MDGKSIASVLNRYFASVFERENDSNIPQPRKLREFDEQEKLKEITLCDGYLDFFYK